MYDAGEDEIRSLARDADGALWAVALSATASVDEGDEDERPVHRMSVGVERVQLVQKQGQQERPQHDQQGDVHVLADGFGAFGI